MMTLCMTNDALHLDIPSVGGGGAGGGFVGVITEDGSAWITDENGNVIRTEDQPQQP
jgi:hypothetical protein